MPYLDSKIDIDKHKKNCINRVGKRLYIRDYDDKGKQKFVSWGLTCTTCGVVVKEKYERNLTKEERDSLDFHHKLRGTSDDDKEYIKLHRLYKIRRKLRRLKRSTLGKDPITPREGGLRSRIKNLKGFYEHQSYYCSDKSFNGLWDDNLVNQFLYLSPRPTLKELSQVFYLPNSVINVDSQRKYTLRGYVPNPEKEGWLKYDKEAYVNLLKFEAQQRIQLMQDIIKSRVEK